MVLDGYPIRFPMTCLEEHPLVESATRLKVRTSKKKKKKTSSSYSPRSLLPSYTGAYLGNSLIGNITVNPSFARNVNVLIITWKSTDPSPSVCSEEHLTDICIQKIKDRTRPTAKIPNCGLGHNAKWLTIPPGPQIVRNFPRQARTVGNTLLHPPAFIFPLNSKPEQSRLQRPLPVLLPLSYPLHQDQAATVTHRKTRQGMQISWLPFLIWVSYSLEDNIQFKNFSQMSLLLVKISIQQMEFRPLPSLCLTQLSTQRRLESIPYWSQILCLFSRFSSKNSQMSLYWIQMIQHNSVEVCLI